MKDISWLTPELLEETFSEFQSKAYGKQPGQREAARYLGALVTNSREAGTLSMEIINRTPTLAHTAALLLSSGIQLGLRLAEKKDGEPWKIKKQN